MFYFFLVCYDFFNSNCVFSVKQLYFVSRKPFLLLQDLEIEMDSHNDTFETADRLGLAVMQSMENMDVSSTQSMIDEYQDLWKSIKKRLGEYRASLAAATTITYATATAATNGKASKKNKKKRQQEQQQQQQQAAVVEPKVEAVTVAPAAAAAVVAVVAAVAAPPTLVNESVQVSTLKFETDRAVQVDTLPPLMRLTSKEGYQMELDAALQECTDHLDTLQTAIQSSTPQIAEATIAANNLVSTICSLHGLPLSLKAVNFNKKKKCLKKLILSL